MPADSGALLKQRRVVIVGAGASGTLLAVQLLRQATIPLEVVLVGPGRPGRGLAYGTTYPQHLLNVPAGGMSALPDRPDHFTQWLEATGAGLAASSFAPRTAYGEYLGALLDEAVRSAAPGVRLNRIESEAASVAIRTGSAEVRIAGRGEAVSADRVALAVGNLAGPGPLPELVGDHRYLSDPWAEGVLERIAPREPILVIGTGLTMIDLALVLVARGRVAPIHCVSRHGLLPRSHQSRPAAAGSPTLPLLSDPKLRSWTRWTRRQAAVGTPPAWRAALDALRPVTPELWQRLDHADRRRFLRHLRTHWDVHRHRIPPSAAVAVEDLCRSGRIVLEAARVGVVRPQPDALEVTLAPRGGGSSHRLRVGGIINATGPETDVTRAESGLLRQLLQDGLVRPDALRLGLEATPAGALCDAAGRASPVLYTLGPLLRGILWETTAVPEIRQQARMLARTWLEARATSDRVPDSR